MRVVLTFDTELIFAPEVRGDLEAYFRGELPAWGLRQELGLDTLSAAMLLAGVFSVALDAHNPAATLTIPEPTP